MTTLAKTLFVFTSYGPLWLLIAVRFGSVEPHAKLAAWAPSLAGAFYAASVGSVIVFFALQNIASRTNSISVTIEEYGRKDDHILAYVVTYFPPLFSLNLGAPSDLWSMFILYATVAIVYIRLDAYYVNPFFALAGYRVFEITTAGGNTYAALVKRDVVLKKGNTISGRAFGDIFISEGS